MNKHIRDAGEKKGKPRLLYRLILALLCLGVLAASAFFAVRTVHLSTKVAEIPIDMRIDFSGEYTLDLGAPGMVSYKPVEPLPLGVGVIVRIESVNPDSTINHLFEGDQSELTGDAIGEIAGYFMDESDRLQDGLIRNLVGRFAIFAGGGLVMLFFLNYLRGKMRWTRRRVFRVSAAGAAFCLILSVTCGSLYWLDNAEKGKQDDTPAAFSIDLSFGQIIFKGGLSMPAKMVNDIIQDTDRRGEEFTAAAVSAVTEALADPRYHVRYPDIMMVHVTDIHDNLYMYPVVGAIAKETGARIVLDTGDVTKTGSSVENVFVAYYLQTLKSSGVKDIYYVRGNHDTKTTDDQMAKGGATVLEGIVERDDGLVIGGWGDPMHTELAASIHTAERTGKLKAQDQEIHKALKDWESKHGRPVNILMTHAPSIGKAVRKDGLANLQLAGHKHLENASITPGKTVLLEGNNTNGETPVGQNEMFGTSIGPIRRDVEISVISWNRISGVFRCFVVTIKPSGAASVSEIETLWPRPAPPEIETETPPETSADDFDGAASTETSTDDPDGTA